MSTSTKSGSCISTNNPTAIATNSHLHEYFDSTIGCSRLSSSVFRLFHTAKKCCCRCVRCTICRGQLPRPVYSLYFRPSGAVDGTVTLKLGCTYQLPPPTTHQGVLFVEHQLARAPPPPSTTECFVFCSMHADAVLLPGGPYRADARHGSAGVPCNGPDKQGRCDEHSATRIWQKCISAVLCVPHI